MRSPDKRILLVMASPYFSGLSPENHIRAKAVYDNPDFDVDIYCFPIGEDVSKDNVHITRSPKIKIFKSFQIGQYKKILVYVFLMMTKLALKRDKKYDVIFLFNSSYLFFWLIKPLYKGKVVATIYTSLAGEMTKWDISSSKFLSKKLKQYEKFVLSKYDRLIFNLSLVKRNYETEGYEPKKSLLILHASESRNTADSNCIAADTFNVLYAGSFVKVQNIDLIYQVASILKNQKKIKFILIGASEEEFEVESKKVREMDLDNVELHKRVDHKQLWMFYQNASILISTRVSGDDLPFKIIEYMSWGKCIIATDRPIHNCLLNKEITCLVEPEPEIIASIISDFLRNPYKIRQYEKNVSNYFMENHTFESMKGKYNKLIYELQESGV